MTVQILFRFLRFGVNFVKARNVVVPLKKCGVGPHLSIARA